MLGGQNQVADKIEKRPAAAGLEQKIAGEQGAAFLVVLGARIVNRVVEPERRLGRKRVLAAPADDDELLQHEAMCSRVW